MRRRGFLKTLLAIAAAPAILIRNPDLHRDEFTWDCEDGPTYDHLDTYLGVTQEAIDATLRAVPPHEVVYPMNEKMYERFKEVFCR